MNTRRSRPLIERFMEKFDVDPATGCWSWTGAIVPTTGYGAIGEGAPSRRLLSAHVASYMLFVPRGRKTLKGKKRWEIDHKCHNDDPTCKGGVTCLHRRCVNPDHLRIATHRQNTLASRNTGPGVNARKTHCKHGHPFDRENTRFERRGSRTCRACNRIRLTRRREAFAENNPAVKVVD